jgi:hypothetical protein
MEEYYYFPSLDLLIKATYSKEANSLRYTSHRGITQEERQTVERYVLTEIGPQTDYYSRSPSILLYVGVDSSLEKELKFYRLQGPIKEILKKHTFIDEKVSHVINESLSNYYFEKLGDELLVLRKAIAENDEEAEIQKILTRVNTLLSAYNQRSGKSIALDAVLPKEVKNRLVYKSEK